MSRISFFYDRPSVYKVTLRALERRDYTVTESNEDTGIIKAESKKGVFKPKINFEMKVNPVSENQTVLDIILNVKNGWLTPDGYEAKAENKLINTLYKCFDNI